MTVVNVSTCKYLKLDPQVILCDGNSAKINEHESNIKDENLSTETTEIRKCKMKNKEESVPLVCNICNKSFERRKQMDRHILIHNQERKHKCEECGKCFLEKNKLTRHLSVHKPKNKTIPCLLCDKSFSSEFSLRDHQKRCHEGQLKRIVCTICGKDYIDIKCHMKQVHSENSSTKQFKCEQCPKEFKNKIGLVKHIQIKHENNPPPANILCTVCGKRCYSRNELNNHMTKHTNVRSFPCTMCDKSYKLLGALNYHLRSHLNIRPFTCDICSKSFYSSKILKCHLRIHSGEKPYVCRLCGKAFTQDGALRNHFKVHLSTQ